MPNWCINELTIFGDDLTELKEAVDGEGTCLDFEKIAAVPEELMNLSFRGSVAVAIGMVAEINSADDIPDGWEVERLIYESPGDNIPIDRVKLDKEEIFRIYQDHEHFDWYSWRCANWGTKWNVTASRSELPNGKELTYTFDSAWSPPEPIVRKLSEMYPDHIFELRYWEGGCDFSGEYVCVAGEVVFVRQGDAAMMASYFDFGDD